MNIQEAINALRETTALKVSVHWTTDGEPNRNNPDKVCYPVSPSKKRLTLSVCRYFPGIYNHWILDAKELLDILEGDMNGEKNRDFFLWRQELPKQEREVLSISEENGEVIILADG